MPSRFAHPRRASASDLPVEILLLIFTQVYLENRTSIQNVDPEFHDGDYDGDEIPVVWTQVDISERSLFPYALVSVCRLWRNIMQSVPEFWTRIFIFYDTQEFSLASMKSHIEASGALPIEILVTNRGSRFYFGKPTLEQARLRKIIDIVIPHLHRCESLSFQTIYPSSLPSVAADLQVHAPMLQYIFLEAFESSDVALSPSLPNVEFQFPALIHLSINGWSFIDLWKNAQTWFEQWVQQKPFQASMRVSDYHLIATDDTPFDLISAIPLLRKFTTLDFHDVHFQCPLRPAIPPQLVQLQKLTMSNLDRSTTCAFLQAQFESVEYLTIGNCPLTTDDVLPNCLSLTLEDDIPSNVLSAVIARWTGGDLTITECPGLNDDVFSQLGETVFVEQQQVTRAVNAPRMTLLTIFACYGFSIGALKSMVENRIGTVNTGNLTRVEGFRVPRMSLEDREWFEAQPNRPLISWRDDGDSDELSLENGMEVVSD
ncbi:hypothetical protein H0H81_002577 [Sphagnurus paluster]|uniref:F-box domain-containing protein n=1 Tax=Sphagnurus paluster TaxID=117069 RepID=A0A9P7GHC6_9AGAR|nr:hypothetical protein H0H81_002577 [Sphagnurus paluster]